MTSSYSKNHHLRPTASSYHKQSKRGHKFSSGKNENGDYFTLTPYSQVASKEQSKDSHSNSNDF